VVNAFEDIQRGGAPEGLRCFIPFRAERCGMFGTYDLQVGHELLW